MFVVLKHKQVLSDVADAGRVEACADLNRVALGHPSPQIESFV